MIILVRIWLDVIFKRRPQLEESRTANKTKESCSSFFWLERLFGRWRNPFMYYRRPAGQIRHPRSLGLSGIRIVISQQENGPLNKHDKFMGRLFNQLQSSPKGTRWTDQRDIIRSKPRALQRSMSKCIQVHFLSPHQITFSLFICQS